MTLYRISCKLSNY